MLQPTKSSITETLLSLLKHCIATKTLKQIHAQMLTNSIHGPNFLLPKLIDLRDFNYASLLFSHISEPDEYAFNVMIRGLTTTWKCFNLTLEVYYSMKFAGLKPNNFTYPFLFIACANLSALDHGQLGHSSVFKNGLRDDGHVRNSLISMYSRCGELGSARKVFDEITEKDLVSWNSMISGYAKMRFAADAIGLFRKMRDEEVVLDEMTLASVLTACADLGDWRLGRWIEGFVIKNNMEHNSYIGSSLIDMYAKCGDLVSARAVFDRLPRGDVVNWNAMITGYAQNGASVEAIVLFDRMRQTNIQPDKITIVEVLCACASIGALDFGKYIAEYVSERGLQNDVYVATALIDMYAKCGCLNHALEVFHNMPQKNVVSWNAMIFALALNGSAMEALALFKCMLREHEAVWPDGATFLGVLSACVHAGLVDEGHQLFDLMSSSFGLVPKIEHYSCMVDLLARAGHLHEAWDFMMKLPRKSDEVVLGTLLGACKRVRNVDIGERVIQLLLEIEPSDSVNFIISSKIFASMKRWDKVARMRLLMRQNGVTKTPGCSWIEIENQVHGFYAGDGSNLDLHGTYQLLNLLMKELTIEECVQNGELWG
ncbi:hypothetical protein Ancab_014565 [Ancistrocladus abbreviatus]